MNLGTKLQKFKKLSYLHLGNMAVKSGIMAGGSDYTKFIILGWARTGSNFLRGVLNSHREIIVFNEIFRDYNTIDWGMPGFDPLSHHLLPLIQNDPVTFLETQIFKKYPKYTSAVGFKIFYYHATNEPWNSVWPYLQNEQDLRIIHLKRKNILKTCLSEKRAWRTGKWVNTSGTDPEQISVTVDYEDCLNYFSAVREQEEKHDKIFENHHKIVVYYETLVNDYSNEAKRIQEFLEVKDRDLTPTTYKQSNLSLSRAITNYPELKEKFHGTRWEEFFED